MFHVTLPITHVTKKGEANVLSTLWARQDSSLPKSWYVSRGHERVRALTRQSRHCSSSSFEEALLTFFDFLKYHV